MAAVKRGRLPAAAGSVLAVLVLLGCGSDPGGTAAQSDTAVASPDSTATAATTGGSAPATTSAPPQSSSVPSSSVPTPQPSSPGVVVTVTKVIDGDTIDTTAGRVRLIGIDTPERGDCNYGAASDELAGKISEQSDQVVLVRSGGGDDVDRYGRLLRYVDTIGGQDLNLHMITSGYAVTRYDSRDGYARHDREDTYVAADEASPAKPCP
ncbi:MAG: thermonuclease family protein [Actinobacteria bacterium]|nr:thermonuclease family protein [Actinomycetota bacterium]